MLKVGRPGSNHFPNLELRILGNLVRNSCVRLSPSITPSLDANCGRIVNRYLVASLRVLPSLNRHDKACRLSHRQSQSTEGEISHRYIGDLARHIPERHHRTIEFNQDLRVRSDSFAVGLIRRIFSSSSAAKIDRTPVNVIRQNSWEQRFKSRTSEKSSL